MLANSNKGQKQKKIMSQRIPRIMARETEVHAGVAKSLKDRQRINCYKLRRKK